MAASLKPFIEECETKVKSGQGIDLIPRLKKLNAAKMDREDRLPLANICRRLSLIDVGLRILGPVVREDKLNEPARSSEKGEYAVLLMRNGSLSEAMRLLAELNEDETGLHMAFCHIIRWEPSKAVPLLEGYIGSRLQDYSTMIARVNLANVLYSLGRFDDGLKTMNESLEIAEAKGYHRLAANNHELRARIYVSQGDFARAHADLDSAYRILEKDAGTDLIMLNRWRAIAEALEQKKAEPLLRFREQALFRKHWDSVRETDLFLLKIGASRERHEMVYFGSPYPEFRDRLKREIQRDVDSETYVVGKEGGAILDIRNGSLENCQFEFQEGGKIHQLIEILIRDLYRPISLGGLFEELFPGQYFDIRSSPTRIHQLLRRTRAWAKKAKLPVTIHEIDGTYRLEITGDFGFRRGRDKMMIDADQLDWQKFEASLERGSHFTAQEISNGLGVSRTRALQLLKWASEANLVEKHGNNRSTRYSIR